MNTIVSTPVRPLHKCDPDKNRLLVLEDEIAVGEMIVHATSRWGVNSQRVTTIPAFRETYIAFKPNLLVLDLVLGEQDVCPAIEFLGSRRCTAPIFFLSGYNKRLIETVASLARSYGLLVADAYEKQREGLQRLMYKLDAYLIR